MKLSLLLVSLHVIHAIKDLEVFDNSVRNFLFSPKHKQSLDCPWTSIVTISASSDFATQMWEYCTVYAVARYTGLDPFVPPLIHRKLSLIFRGLTVRSFARIVRCKFNPESFVYKFSDWTNMDQSLLISKGVIELPLILKYIDVLIDQFQLTENFKNAGKTAIQRALKYHTSDTVVGIYVNKIDLEDLSSIQEAMVFYGKAMDYFRKNYENVTFLTLCGTNPICSDNFYDQSDVYIYKYNNIERLDVAILSLCDHVIFKNGGIGLWGGLLAGGKTVYSYCDGLVVNNNGDITIIKHLMETNQTCRNIKP